MRILYPSMQPLDRSPGQRYRFEQFASYLQSRGCEIEYAPALSDEDLRLFHRPGHLASKAKMAAKAFARRAWSVAPRLARPKFDVVFVQREAFFLFGAWSEFAASLQAPIVFDFDDAIWIRAVSEGNRRWSFLKNVDKISKIATRAHTVLAGNSFLGNWARQYNANVTVIPTCVDTDLYTPAPSRAGGPVVIGWCGSPATIPHLRLILPVFERLNSKYGDSIRIRVMGDPSFIYPALNLRGEPWSSAAELKFLRAMDIGVMPLPDDEWSKGKCGLKGLTSMACGAATVLSAVGVNTQIVSHGQNGLLAASESDWLSTLETLILNHDLRRRLSAQGRETVVEHYSVRRWRETLYDCLTHAAAERDAPHAGR